jgi:hypothetical protein
MFSPFLYGWRYSTNDVYNIWLVVLTPLKNISQLGVLFPIYGKMKNVPNHQPMFIGVYTKT